MVNLNVWTNNISTSLTNQVNNERHLYQPLAFHIYLTLKMTSAQVVETSVNVTSNNPSQDYTQADDHNLRTYNMTPGFKPFTVFFSLSGSQHDLLDSDCPLIFQCRWQDPDKHRFELRCKNDGVIKVTTVLKIEK